MREAVQVETSGLHKPDDERPEPSPLRQIYGSDLIADTLREIGVDYIAINPGASYRGLHDSLVNRLGNVQPQMLLCLHEVTAVGIAHGFAKVTGRPMAVALHSNVGLMHGAMAIFNAWCDRMPMMVLGATGPVDAAKRRPWIDWIHTSRDQASMVRSFVKWDDQPSSAAAAREALLRGAWLTQSYPEAPVYINFDAGVQEDEVAEPSAVVPASSYMPQVEATLSKQQVTAALDLCRNAVRPLIILGRVSRDTKAWEQRIQLAQTLGARVVTDMRTGAGFPTSHPLHAGTLDRPEAREAIASADLILGLDAVDLAGALKAVATASSRHPTVIHVTQDYQLHNGASMDHQALARIDLVLATRPDTAVAELCQALDAPTIAKQHTPPAPHFVANDKPITLTRLAVALAAAAKDASISLCRTPTGWRVTDWPLNHPLDYLGGTGGAGLGGGPGIAVGCALGLRAIGSTRVPVSIMGDGDFLMGATALWTAVHYRLPLLVIIANNCAYRGDEVHQRHIADIRGRNMSNSAIGLRISDPEMDLCAMARSQGAQAFGPITEDRQLVQTLRQAIDAVAAGAVVLADVRTAN